MSAFRTKLWLEHVDGVNWVLAAPLVYQSDLLGAVVVAPAGMDTDLASVPRELQGILPASGPYNPAAVIHDGGYFGRLRSSDGQPVSLTKAESDLVFREAMLASGVDARLAEHMYQIVKLFGRLPTGARVNETNDTAMSIALSYLNAYFQPWTFGGDEPCAIALADLLRKSPPTTSPAPPPAPPSRLR
jgi:hypothetical protein